MTERLAYLCIQRNKKRNDGQQYARLRIGVGPPADRQRDSDLADYVLGKAGKSERKAIEELFPDLVALTECWLGEGVEKAMSLFNRKADGGSGMAD